MEQAYDREHIGGIGDSYLFAASPTPEQNRRKFCKLTIIRASNGFIISKESSGFMTSPVIAEDKKALIATVLEMVTKWADS